MIWGKKKERKIELIMFMVAQVKQKKFEDVENVKAVHEMIVVNASDVWISLNSEEKIPENIRREPMATKRNRNLGVMELGGRGRSTQMKTTPRN